MMSWRGEKVLILTASSGLGSFAPALRLSAFLRAQGGETHLYCLEQLFCEDALNRHQVTQSRCRESFRTALLLQKVVENGGADLNQVIDPDKLATMIHLWQQIKFTRCIVFSGFWLSVLFEVQSQFVPVTTIDAIHMDAVPSTSWLHAQGVKQKLAISVRDIYLFKENRNDVFPLFPIAKPIEWEARSGRVLCHGGGWQMGNLSALSESLKCAAICSDVIVSADATISSSIHQRVFKTDPGFKPWSRADALPELKLCAAKNLIDPEPDLDFDQLAASAVAIITKPGGASLLDSFNFATPLILLPAFGEYEVHNAQTWQSLGFAVTFEQWQSSNYSLELLHTLHNNLLNQSSASPIFGVSNETRN
ncbi:hypothetical protein [Pseudoalteromonas luteoviolacea]|uniref:hypothetical protein n=1 Tax=Pseudoalteromonas luteoviolacea TaxID=43657 RepID=UPI001153CC96|nr:hypothetical protein [Pseudoalteromonas luteoviolacea]TQF72756.1 hypothetical protein FLM44_17670 [Pseudoalteromonas luteoviolacea]